MASNRGPGPRRAQQPARRRPAQHQLRRRQHLREGHGRPTRSPATTVELLWVKGSGGDLGTLTEAGLAVLRLDRLRALVDVYPGVDREDEMVAAFDYCLHGQGGAAPSIDTAMHGLVDAAHVDHLHPDSGIAIATAADGEALTKEFFGDRVAWVPWRRPGFQLGLDIAAIKRASPQADRRRPGRSRHHRLGRDQRGVRGGTRSTSSAPPRPSSTSAGVPTRSARSSPVTSRCPRASGGRGPRRWSRCCAGWRPPTGRRSGTSPTPRRCSTSSPGSGTRRWRRSAPRARTTSCAPRCGRWCSTCRRRRRWRRSSDRLRELHAEYRDDYRAYYERYADDVDRRRCAVPTRRSCSSRASACSASARTSRPHGWPASSTSTRST